MAKAIHMITPNFKECGSVILPCAQKENWNYLVNSANDCYSMQLIAFDPASNIQWYQKKVENKEMGKMYKADQINRKQKGRY